MNIIKNLIGMKSFLIVLIFSTLFFLSCEKDSKNLDFYDIVFINNYFENIDSAFLGSVKTSEIKVSDKYVFQNISNGKHLIKLYTKSKLMISADLFLQGHNDTLIISVSSSGKILYDR